MKTKHVVLGLLAVVFAVGSAFTSADFAQIARVKVRYTDQPAGSFTCQNTGLTCQQEVDGQNCTVNIVDLGAPAPGLNSTCTVQLIHLGSAPSAGSYDHPTRTIAEIVPFE